MLQGFKDTPEMSKAIKDKLFGLVVHSQLGKMKVSDFVYAVFIMGRDGLKLEDLTEENVISRLPPSEDKASN